MKALLTSLMALALSPCVHSQTMALLQGPPVARWARDAREIQSAKQLSTDDILHPPEGTLPAALMDTLLKYDWLDAGTYCFQEEHLVKAPPAASARMGVYRFMPDGSCTDFTILLPETDSEASVKKGSSGGTEKFTLRTKAGRTFLCFTGDLSDCLSIMSYRDGVLMYDVDDGAAEPGDEEYPVRYRNVLIAVPKGF